MHGYENQLTQHQQQEEGSIAIVNHREVKLA